MKKVNLLDWNLIRKSLSILFLILSITSTILSFLDFSISIKVIILICTFLLSFIIHLSLWVRANFQKSITLKVHNSDLIVSIGDIFSEKGLKIIPFNEYFDTSFDHGLISEESLHGKFLKMLDSPDELRNKIEKFETDNFIETNASRKLGNKKKYKLGTILCHDDYLLLAFSHFDEFNRAYITRNEYVNCLMNMWDEIDKVFDGKTVCIPLLGSGLTRFKDGIEISDQELLSIIIWSFEISKVKFKYPHSAKIIIFEKSADKVNLFGLRK